MKISTFLMVLGLSSLLFLSGCLGKKKLNTSETGSVLSAETILENIRQKDFNFKFFNSDLNLNINSEDFSGSVSAKCRIISDESIWMSLSKFGFELGRLKVTQDSIFAFERVERTFFKASFKDVSTLVGLDVNYKLLEDFLLGKPFLGEESPKINFIHQDTVLILPVLEPLFISHLIDIRTFYLHRSTFEEALTGIKADLVYSQYAEFIPGLDFSYFRTVDVEEDDNQMASIAIKFSKPELNIEKSTAFKIPDHYTERTF